MYDVNLRPGGFKNAFRLFKRFSLIFYDENEMEENSKVKLYPTLQFCMDIEQLKQVMKEYLPDEESQFEVHEEDAELVNEDEEEE